VDDAHEFGRWMDGERDRLARACAQVLERTAAAAAAVEGNHVAAVEWWRRLAAHDPPPRARRMRTGRACRMELEITMGPPLHAFVRVGGHLAGKRVVLRVLGSCGKGVCGWSTIGSSLRMPRPTWVTSSGILAALEVVIRGAGGAL
jgi:hypothetical protein